MERLGLETLSLLLGGPTPWDAANRPTDWRALLRLARRNVVLVRVDERLQARGIRAPRDPWASAVAAERARIRSTVEVIGRLAEICGSAAVDFVLTKSFQHFPDMGHDVDLLVLDRSRRVDGLLAARLVAMPGRGSLTHRVAGKRAFVVPGCPSPVELHHGRLGLLGEYAAYPAQLVRRRQPLEVDGVRTWVPSPEDQLLVQALQRIYVHLSLRFSEVLSAATALRSAALDWDYLAATARAIGILDGLACYVGYVQEIHRRSAGARLEAPAVRVLAAPRWAGSPRFRGDAYRFPVARVLGRVYGAKLLADVKTRNWRGVGRLGLLLPLAVVVGARNLARLAARSWAGLRPAHAGGTQA